MRSVGLKCLAEAGKIDVIEHFWIGFHGELDGFGFVQARSDGIGFVFKPALPFLVGH